MALERRIAVTFNAISKKDGYYTLDGKKKLCTHIYVKEILSIDELTEIERDTLLLKYDLMKSTLTNLSKIVNKINEINYMV